MFRTPEFHPPPTPSDDLMNHDESNDDHEMNHDENIEDSPQRPLPSESPFDRATATLASLRADLLIFQDPNVRDYLSTIPTSHPPPPPPQQASPEQLHAINIALRTQLDAASTALQSSKDAHLETRKRAARAEGRIKELDRMIEEARKLHANAVSDARARIDEMEEEFENERKQGDDRRFKQTELYEVEKASIQAVKRERDDARTENLYLKDRLNAMKNDLEAEKRNNTIGRRHEEQERNADQRRIALLETELETFKRASSEMKQLRNEKVGEVSAIVDRLQAESVRLKKELQWRTSEAVRMQRQVMDAETALKTAREQMNDADNKVANATLLEHEVRILREQARNNENASDNLRVLNGEKEELSRLIARLSPTGNVQEGLQILQTHVPGTPLQTATATKRMPLGVRREETIDQIRRQCEAEVAEINEKMKKYKQRSRELESSVQDTVKEKEAAEKASKLIERRQKILQRENEFLKKAVADLQSDGQEKSKDKGEAGTSEVEQVLKTTLDQCLKSNQEYKNMIKELEERLQSVESQAKDLTSMSDGDEESGASELRQQIVQAKEAVEMERRAREAAESRAATSTLRLAELESEVERLKIASQKEALADKMQEDCGNENVPGSDAASKQTELSGELSRDTAGSGDDAARINQLETQLTQQRVVNGELEQKVKIAQRTKEVARKRIEDVRAAVQIIFGWSMRVHGATFIISSLYAEGPREELMFRGNEEGEFNLLETEYAKRVHNEIEQYVYKNNSFPLLLAHITMENFEKTTAMG